MLSKIESLYHEQSASLSAMKKQKLPLNQTAPKRQVYFDSITVLLCFTYCVTQ